MPIVPVFQQHVDPDLCFVLMPFASRFANVFQVVQSVVEGYAGCKCLRADQIATPSQITGDIWERIQRARFLIADVTGQNPNVFYEVGFSHALHKNVILLVEEGSPIPFDIQGIRYIRYAPTDLRDLRQNLPLFIKQCLQTVSHQWNSALVHGGPAVRVSHLEWPETGAIDRPFQITAHARNFGKDARQGYLSMSFPSGVKDVKVVRSDLQTTVGHKGDAWRSGEVILQYPIAEGFIYVPTAQSGWRASVSHFITVEAIPARRGLIQFYVGSGSQTGDLPFAHDPKESPLLDHRGEPVYCGVIEVR